MWAHFLLWLQNLGVMEFTTYATETGFDVELLSDGTFKIWPHSTTSKDPRTVRESQAKRYYRRWAMTKSRKTKDYRDIDPNTSYFLGMFVAFDQHLKSCECFSLAALHSRDAISGQHI